MPPGRGRLECGHATRPMRVDPGVRRAPDRDRCDAGAGDHRRLRAAGHDRDPRRIARAVHGRARRDARCVRSRHHARGQPAGHRDHPRRALRLRPDGRSGRLDGDRPIRACGRQRAARAQRARDRLEHRRRQRDHRRPAGHARALRAERQHRRAPDQRRRHPRGAGRDADPHRSHTGRRPVAGDDRRRAQPLRERHERRERADLAVRRRPRVRRARGQEPIVRRMARHAGRADGRRRSHGDHAVGRPPLPRDGHAGAGHRPVGDRRADRHADRRQRPGAIP